MERNQNSSDPEQGSSTKDRTISNPDAMRRDAIARNLCTRICSERRTDDELEQLDSLLTLLENGVDSNTLLGRLLADRYNEDEGNETDRIHRRGWNAGMRHATSIVQLHRGLTEIRRQAFWPIEERFDLGGES